MPTQVSVRGLTCISIVFKRVWSTVNFNVMRVPRSICAPYMEY